MRKPLVAALIAGIGLNAHAALGTGDLAFTSFNADEDGWSLVTFIDIAAGTTVFFTDNEWTGAGFNTGESYHRWNSGAGSIAAGTVVRFSRIDSATLLAASVGTLTRETVAGSTNYGISQDADSIYAFAGASAAAPATLLAAVSSGNFAATGETLAGTGLAVGVNALAIGNGSDYAEYAGARSALGSFAAYKPLVADVARWNDLGTGSYAAKVPDTTAFTVTPVPEPETYALMLAGLGLMGAAARRRRA